MYKILTFENGQPFILYCEEEKVNMYSISGGRISLNGTVFDDVKENFSVFNTPSIYVTYISVSNYFKLSTLRDYHFVELLKLSLNTDENTKVKQIYPILYKNTLYIFYSVHMTDSNYYSIYYIKSSLPGKSSLLLSNAPCETNFFAFGNNENVFFILTSKDTDYLYKLDQNENLIFYKNFDVHAEETSKKLTEDNITLKKKIIAKNKEIADLKKIQQHISNQYNELAEYAKQLQNELRKKSL